MQMTPEQKERIEQIQSGDQEWRKTAYDLGDVLAGHESDVDFLLSLVKEQEPYTCEACGRSDEHTPECPTAAWCPGCGSRVIGHQWNTCHDAATAMRSACVEKVKSLAVAHRALAGGLTDGIMAELQRIRADECDAVASALETLSIEQPKE